MPKPYSREFRDDGVRVEQIAKDFGVHPMTLFKWLRQADVDAGTRLGVTSSESAQLREARARIKRRSFRLLKVVRRPAALAQLVWAAPVVVSGLLVGLFLTDTFTDLITTPERVQPDWHAFLRALYFLVPLGLLTGLLALLASLATMHVVVQAAVGRPPSVRDALRTAGPRVPAYMGWGFLVVL